jgi:hypothetical protein
MISVEYATLVVLLSLAVLVWCFLRLSKYEGSYVNILVPSLLIAIPAHYILPLGYMRLFGTEGSPYAYIYVYAALAVENVAFVLAYTRTEKKIFRLPFTASYRNFTWLAIGCLVLSGLIYVPVLLQFREFLLDPRQIYNLTRTGFGPQSFLSSTLAYLAIIFILFTNQSRITKSWMIATAFGLLLLHGSKGQVLNAVLILALFYAYVQRKKVRFKAAIVVGSALALIVLLLFAGTMTVGDSPIEMVESLTQYSDYTRNAMLVIDAHFPVQLGRLTVESNTISLVPRALFPNKPRNFGSFFLTEHFYPEWFDADTSPAFGIGVQYADFGSLAIVYIALFGLFKGWMARVFVNRVQRYRHPADFLVLAFLADIGLFPLGIGWFLPETILLALMLRFLSTVGAERIYLEPLSDPLSSSVHRPASLRGLAT